MILGRQSPYTVTKSWRMRTGKLARRGSVVTGSYTHLSLFVYCLPGLITHRPSRFGWLYRFLVDPNTLNISNKWRRDRGLPELRMADIAPEQQASA